MAKWAAQTEAEEATAELDEAEAREMEIEAQQAPTEMELTVDPNPQSVTEPALDPDLQLGSESEAVILESEPEFKPETETN